MSSKQKKRSTSSKLECGLYIVGVPIGNTLDWSDRAKDVLANVDVVAAEDTRTTKASLLSVGVKPKKLVAHHEHNEVTSAQGLLSMLQEGLSVALVTDAGTPQISDPGYRIVSEAYKAKIPVIPVPGPSSLSTALSVSPIGGNQFFFAGFLPVQQEARKEKLQTCRSICENLVFFEAPHRLRATLQDCLEVYSGDTKAFVCRELTKPYEELISGSLDEVNQHFNIQEPRGEFVVMIQALAHPTWDLEKTKSEIRVRLERGMSASDILQDVKPRTNLNRKALYDLIVDIKSR